MFGDELLDEDGPAGDDDPLRVLICDQHDLVRRSLTASLEEARALEVVAEAADAVQAVTEALHVAPDLVFVSLLLPELTGIQTIGLIAEVMPGIDVVALTVEESPEEGFDALRAGACGVVCKEEVLASPVSALARLQRGLPFVDAELAGLLLERFDDLVGADGPLALSPSEREVLDRMAGDDEEDEEEIAAAVDLTPGQVRNHVLNVLGRLHREAPTPLRSPGQRLLVTVAS